jgi:hypothetical protein
MREYYFFETKIKELYERLREFLKISGIYYEVSGAGDAWHFEIKCNEQEAENTDRFLDDFFNGEFMFLY